MNSLRRGRHVSYTDPVDDAIVYKIQENSMTSMSSAAGNGKKHHSVPYITKGLFYTAAYFHYR